MKTLYYNITLLGFFLFLTQNIFGQSGLCDSNTPFYNVDLSSNPDSVWISPPDIREGNCCGTSHPKRCIEFEVLLEPNAAGVIFDIYSGAMPSGALFYQINCGPEVPVGDTICLEGPGPHTITFCKPGSNQNEYTIQSIPGTFSLYGSGTTKGCDADIYVEGLIDSTIVWHELTSGTGAYDSLFTCLTGCDTTQFNSRSGMPDSLQIQVCGYLEPSVCSFTSIYRCDTLVIPINEPLSIELDAYYKFTCYDELPFEIAPTINGYTPSVVYEWYDSTDLLGNMIGTDSILEITETGYYSVLVYDTLFSACSRDTANVFIEVFPFPEISPISNDTLCLGDSLTVTPTITVGSLNWYINDTLYCGGCPSATFNPLSNFTVTVELTDSIGCIDSTEFSIYTNPTFAPSQTVEICDNDSFVLPSGIVVDTAGTYVDSFATVHGCDSVWTTTVIVLPTFAPNQTVEICDNDSFILPSGIVVNTAGTYVDSFATVHGCDSVWTTTVIVHPTFAPTQTIEICDNDSFLLPSGSYVNTAGTYVDSFATVYGCDSVWTTTVIVHPTFAPTQTVEICDNDSFLLPSGSYVNTAGTYIDSFATVHGCDSVWTTTVIVHPTFAPSQTVEICDNDSFLLPSGTFVNTAGTYVDSFATVYGCDSVWTTTVIVHPTFAPTQTVEICDNDSFLLPSGSYVNTAGTYVDSFATVYGCDSVWTTTVIVHPTFAPTQSVEICDNDSFLLPSGSFVNTAGTYVDSFATVYGCDSVWTTTVIVHPTFAPSQTVEICDNDSFLLPSGSYVNTAGTYVDSFASVYGCDSVWTTTVIVYPTFAPTQTVEICDNDSFLLPSGSYVNTAGTYVDSFATVHGCDSVWTTTVIVHPTFAPSQTVEICDNDSFLLPSGTFVNTAGTYVDSFATAYGCDSVWTTTVIVHPTFAPGQTVEICDNDSFLLPSGTFVNTAGTYVDSFATAYGCDSVWTTTVIVHPTFAPGQTVEICDNDSFVLPSGIVVNTAGTYIDSFAAVYGCDSVWTTTVIVHPTFAPSQTVEICDNDSFLLPGGSYVTTAGTYVDSFATVYGCDSVWTTTVIVHPTFAPSQTVEICDNDSFVLPSGIVVNTAGTYVDSFATVYGCDSVWTTTVIVHPTFAPTQTVEICDNDSFLLPSGSYVTTAGTYVDSFATVYGCDSVWTTTVIVHPTFAPNQTVEICDNDSFLLPSGSYVTTAGTYVDSFATAYGCDSVWTTTVIVHPTFAPSQTVEICDNDSFLLPSGSYVNTAGTYVDSFATVHGCDSVWTTTVIVHPTFAPNQTVEICDNDSFLLPSGFYVNTAGTYVDSFATVHGCDSVWTTTVIVHPTFAPTQTIEICDNDSFLLPSGTFVNTAGTYIDSFATVYGCDSVWTTTVIVHPTFAPTQTIEICDNDSFVLPSGIVVNTAGTYIDSFATVYGCDSVWTTTVIVHPTFAPTQTVEICDNDSFVLPSGIVVNTAGTYVDSFATVYGCDSVWTTTVIVHPTFAPNQTVEICDNDSFVLPSGIVVNTAGTYVDSFATVYGCDSVWTTTVIVHPTFAPNQTVEICDNDSFVLPSGIVVNTAGTYIDSFATVHGCDSVWTTTVIVHPTFAPSQTVEICDNDSFLLPSGSYVNTAGTYVDSFASVYGCDSVWTTTVIVYPTFAPTQTVEICDNDSFLLPSGSYVNTAGTYVDSFATVHGCDSVWTTTVIVHPTFAPTQSVEICDNDSFLLPSGSYVNTAGTYVDSFATGYGCDSVWTTTIIVHPTFAPTQSVEICDNDSFLLPSGSYVNTAGTYVDSFATVYGCDSVWTTTVIVHPTFAPTQTVEICDNDSFLLPSGSYVTTAGTYVDSFATAYGCDSVWTTTVIVHPTFAPSQTVEICDNDSFLLPSGSFVNTAGTYVDSFATVYGCDSVWTTTVIVHPTFAPSQTVEICDNDSFVLPSGIVVNTAGTYVDSFTSAYGCDSVWTTTVIVHPTFAPSQTVEICDNDSFLLPSGSYVNTAGTYVDSFASVYGCDSVWTTTVIVYPTFAPTQTVEICDNDSFLLPSGSYVNTAGTYVDSFATVHGCDSVWTTTVIVHPTFAPTQSVEICDNDSFLLPAGSYVTTAGTYVDSFATVYGCDSVWTTTVIVHPTFAPSQTVEICDNDSFVLPSGIVVNTAGTYVDSFATVYGCDSVWTTTVIVHPTFAPSQTVEICDNDSFLLPSGSYVNTAGTYVDSFATVHGCDSVWTTTVIVHPTFAPTQSIEICDNDSFLLPSGTFVNTAGTYVDSFATVYGCDSVWTTTVIVHPTFAPTQTIEICDNDSFLLPGGSYVTTAGTYIDSFATVYGCDSVWTTTVIVHPTFAPSQTVEICDNDSFLLPSGSYVNTAGTYVDSFATVYGCDSVWTTTVIVHPTFAPSQTVEICDNDSFLLPGGSYVTTAGTYVDSFATVYGCDSVWTTTVIVHPTFAPTQTVEICDNDSFLLPSGSYITTAGTYVDSFATVYGCDSVWTTTVIVYPTFAPSQTVEICDNDSFVLPSGIIVNTAGTYVDSFATVYGCDSVWTTTVIVHPTFAPSQTVEICDNDSFLLPSGTFVNTAGTYVDSFATVYGCDSVWTTTVIVHPTFAPTQTVEICDNDSFLLPGGIVVNTAGTYVDSFATVHGCDSVWTTTVIVHPTFAPSQTVEICDNDSFLLPSGSYVNTAGTYVDSFATVHGCDSVWTTTVIVHPTFAPSQTVEICDNDSFVLPSGIVVNTAGTYVDSFATVYGCDSVWTTTVIVRELVTTNIPQIICEGNEVEINGIIYNQAGTYTDTLNSQSGCDSILIIDISILKSSAGKIDTTICPNSYIHINEQTFSDEGEYRINLHNHNGCDSILTLTIHHYPEPFIDAGEDLTVIPNEIFTLESSDFPTEYLSLSWSHLGDTLCTDCFSIEQSTTENTSYVATVVDTNNCFYKDEVLVFLDESCPENGILAPNIITPNGDMHNDEFYIKNPNELEIEYYRIFNRWGELVFETYDPNGKWDGTFRNQICNPGVYVYYVQAKCFDKSPFMKKGNITILK